MRRSAVVLFLLALVLSACGSSSSEPNDATTTTADVATTTATSATSTIAETTTTAAPTTTAASATKVEECPAPEVLEAEGYTCDSEGNLTPIG